jgi:hypothetical protein
MALYKRAGTIGNMSMEEPSAESAPEPRFESYKDIASNLEAGDVIHTESIDGKITEISYDPDAETQAYVTVERPNKQGEVEEARLTFDRILKFQDAITDIEKPQRESEVMTMPERKFESNPEPEKKKREGKTDWSHVNKLLAKKEEKQPSKMTPEELAEDDLKKKEIEEVRKWAETRHAGKEVTEKSATKDEKQPKQVIDID